VHYRVLAGIGSRAQASSQEDEQGGNEWPGCCCVCAKNVKHKVSNVTFVSERL
jgi:hypothetical protein